MYTISLIGKYRMLFIKKPNLTIAKETANAELKDSIRNPAGKFNYAILQDSDSNKKYRKDGVGSEWIEIKG